MPHYRPRPYHFKLPPANTLLKLTHANTLLKLPTANAFLKLITTRRRCDPIPAPAAHPRYAFKPSLPPRSHIHFRNLLLKRPCAKQPSLS